MGRTPTPSVMFILPSERADNGQKKISGVASYAQRRVRFTVKFKEASAKQESESILHLREVILQIIDRAAKEGLWHCMTSADLSALLLFADEDMFAQRGLFSEWCRIKKAQQG